MHLTVFGGTGGTGAQVISAALDAGHTVIAPARDPARIRASHERLRAVRADVLAPPSLVGTVDGADAVVSALGLANGRRPTTVDWTVVRPPRLTNGPATGRYRRAVNHHLPHGRTISRADLAAEMLRLLDDPHAVRATVGVAY